ncbi:hypothetical protein WCE37_01065 [Luteimonas sp. MJ250]|uniref:hypothetical protein n=1 Tax=Luteimonas sp. MJ250 TaxID=3129236 RepID=UPI0031BA689D
MVEIILFVVFGVCAVLVLRMFLASETESDLESDATGEAGSFDFSPTEFDAWNRGGAWNDIEGHAPSRFEAPLRHAQDAVVGPAVNPATGLPMASGDEFGVDVMGNPFGTDLEHDLAGDTLGSGFRGIASWDSDASDGSDGSSGRCGDWS